MNIIMTAKTAKTGKKCGNTRHTKSKALAMRNTFWMNMSRVIGTRTSTAIKIMLQLRRTLNLTWKENNRKLCTVQHSYVHDLSPFVHCAELPDDFLNSANND